MLQPLPWSLYFTLFKRSYKTIKSPGKHYGCCRRNSGAHQILSKTGKHPWLYNEQVEFESEPEEKANDITKLSQTRWTVRATCLQRVIDNYEALMKLWIHCLDSKKMESELKGRIIGVMQSFELYFGLHLGARFYSHTDNLARSVQNKGMSACTSKRLANLTIQTLETLRNEERYETFTKLC